MEKTIEQRAKEAFPSTGLNDPTWERRGYIQGATDQQKIDIEKACEWLKDELYTDHNEAEYRYPDSVQSRSYFKAEELIEQFKQAMEA